MDARKNKRVWSMLWCALGVGLLGLFLDGLAWQGVIPRRLSVVLVVEAIATLILVCAVLYNHKHSKSQSQPAQSVPNQ